MAKFKPGDVVKGRMTNYDSETTRAGGIIVERPSAGWAKQSVYDERIWVRWCYGSRWNHPTPISQQWAEENVELHPSPAKLRAKYVKHLVKEITGV